MEIDQTTKILLEEHASRRKLPIEGIAVLALAQVLKETGENSGMVPATEMLKALADEIEKSESPTPDHLHSWAEKARYLAQFTITDEVPPYDKPGFL